MEDSTTEKKDVQDTETEGAGQVSAARFTSLRSDESRKGEGQGLDFILDIPVNVVAELGQAQMMLREVLALGVNSVIELNKLIGDPVDVLANGRLVARGEVVVFGEKFAVRITEFVDPARLSATT